MRSYRDLSIRTKLFGGFGLVLVMCIVLGVTLLSEIGSVNTGSDWLAQRVVPNLQHLSTISLDVADFRRAQLKYVLAPDATVKAQVRQEWTTDAAEADQTLQAYARGYVNAQDGQLGQTFTGEWQALRNQTASLAQVAKGAANPAGQALIKKSTPTYNGMVATVRQWVAANVRWAHAQVRTNASTYNFAKTLGLILLVIATLLGALMAWLVSSTIKRNVDVVLDRLRMLQDKCLTFVRDGMAHLAEGDLTHSYQPVTPVIENPAKDEIGQIGQAVNGMRERIVSTLEAYNDTAARLRDAMEHVARTASAVGASSQEMAASSEEAGKANGEIAGAVSEMAQGAERQARMIEQARHAAGEVAEAVARSAQNAQRTAEVAQEARQVAAGGVDAAEEADGAMRAVRESSVEVTTAIRELAAKSDQIGAIVQTIGGIAEQTNLLALNAAIEAARAGEQGRGFAVVAEEVRKLAEESQRAAAEIASLIGAIQSDTGNAVRVVESGAQRTAEGAQVVEQTREAFLKIGGSVDNMTARIEDIAAAAQQVAASVQTLLDGVTEAAAVAEQSSASTEEVSASTEETSASAQQVAASAHELSTTAEELNELVARFKLAS